MLCVCLFLLLAILAPTSIGGGVITVACVGDSITAGSGASDKKSTAYPAVLERLLNEKRDGSREEFFQCINYGVGGKTATKKGLSDSLEPATYWETTAYKTSLVSSPDIVVIGLGTNDAKEHNWNEAAFVKDYSELIASYKRLPSVKEIFVFTPPPLYRPFQSIKKDVVNLDMERVVRRIASENKVHLIDVFTRMGGAALSRPHLFFTPNKPLKWPNDGCHPNDHGYQVLARRICEGLLENQQSHGIYTGPSSVIDEVDGETKKQVADLYALDKAAQGY